MIQSARCVGELHKPLLPHLFAVPAASSESPRWFANELYVHIVKAEKEFGLPLSKSVDFYLTNDITSLMYSLTGRKELGDRSLY